MSLALGIAGTSAASAATLNAGNGNSYEVVPGGMTWHQARSAAAERTQGGPLCAGHLATITTADEQAFLFSTFGAGLHTTWLGGHQTDGATEPAGGWTWITGETWGYTNWLLGEPNNSGGEDALAFLGTNGKWNDAPELYNYGASGGYVVEYECRQVAMTSSPEATTTATTTTATVSSPVAILTTATFDASTVDPATIALDGASVRMKGKSGQAGSLQDVDGDGDLDLVVQIEDTDGTYSLGDATAYLTAKTYSGENVKVPTRSESSPPPAEDTHVRARASPHTAWT